MTEKRILLINIDHRQRGEVSEHLATLTGVRVDECGDGLDAIHMLRNEKYDLVVSDIDLHNLDAWRLTRLIRSDMLCSDAQTRIIILSSTYSERIAEATAKEFEVDRFIPFTELDSLATTAHSLLFEDNKQRNKTQVLVIEDYQDTADLIHRVLHKRYDVTIASDGEAGLQAWREAKHDIVLLDLMLPKMSGQQVLETMLAERPEQSIVMMTAHGDAQKAGELILSGAVDFIAKPFKAEQLRHVVAIAAHREDFVISNEQFKEKQLALSKEKNRAQITLQSIIDGVITTDENGIIDYINPVAQSILKCDSDTALGMEISKLFSTYHESSHIPTANLARRAISENKIQTSSKRCILKDRENNELLIEQQAAPIRNSFGQAVGAVVIFNDQTEVKNFEKQLSYHTKHDYLTGLFNRGIFDQEVRLAIHEADSSDVEHCICQLSLSQFNIVNETSGHRAGDKLLQTVANLLQQKVRAPSDVVARIGGDEFGILLRHCSLETAQKICRSIVEEIDKTHFEFENNHFDINVGIGIVAIDGHIDNLGDAISAASAACSMAKGRGKNRVASYSGEDLELVEKRQEVFYAKELTRAINEGRIKLFQQRIASGSGDGRDAYEILCRVIDLEGNILAPAPYLTAAERYHLTPELDRWVVKNTLKWIEENADFAARCEYFSINISGLSICDETFAGYITSCFRDCDVPPENICLEITETAAISNFVKACDFITAIRDLGCKFALDDFGSGMSSFAYLKKLPIDILKIDGMFVKDILNDPIDLAMVKSINEVGHVMGLKTVAEYVENAEILRVLEGLGVDAFQGYHVAKPAALSDLVTAPAGTKRAG